MTISDTIRRGFHLAENVPDSLKIGVSIFTNSFLLRKWYGNFLFTRYFQFYTIHSIIFTIVLYNIRAFTHVRTFI